MTPDALRALIDASAAARAELRFIHPRATSKTAALADGRIRSRANNDCAAMVPPIPATPCLRAMTPRMWRRHNGCDG